MVQPERVAEETKGTRTPRVVLILATVVIIVIGTSTLGRLTAPDLAEGAGATTTTEAALSQPTSTIDPRDFRVVDIQTGPQVRWARGFGVDDTWPIALLEQQGVFYLFGSAPSEPLAFPTRGLRVWASNDGIFWSEQEQGALGLDFLVDDVVTTDTGLMAMGKDGRDGSPMIWTTDDGLDWASQRVPAPRELRRGEVVLFQASATADNMVFLFGGVGFDNQRLLAGYLPEEMAAAVDSGGFGWGPSSIQLHGPWGITVYSATFEELGIPAEDVQRLQIGFGSDVYAWMSSDGADWQVSQIEDADWIEHASIDEDGTVNVFGSGTFGRMRWSSSDGVGWGANNSPPDLERIAPWGDGFLALRHGGQVAASDDGLTWVDLGVRELFPSDFAWFLNPIAAGEIGVAAFAEGFLSGESRFEEPQPALEKDGYRFSLESREGMLRLDEIGSGDTVFRFTAWSGTVNPHASVDFEHGEVTLLDPDTKEPLVAFSFDELLAAERAAYTVAGNDEQGPSAFLFSEDGIEWLIQDTNEIMGGARVIRLAIREDRFVAVTIEDSFFGRTLPTVTTWVGLLPTG